MYACVLPNCSGQEPQRAARARHGGGAQARQHGCVVLDVQGAQAARREGLTEGGEAREDTRRAQQGKGQAGALRATHALYGSTVVLTGNGRISMECQRNFYFELCERKV